MNSDKSKKNKSGYKEKDMNLVDDLCSEGSSKAKIYNKDVYIYSWGKNKYGELGLNTATNTFIPSAVKSLKLSVIKSVKSGGRNSIILTSNGQVLMCGSNIFNLLATNSKFQNNEQYQKTFKPLKIFEENNEVIKEIAVAEFHSLALNVNGEVFGWGGNLFNKLGQTNGLCGLPSKIYIKRKIISIACGDYHSCALSENGVLYSWGGGGESYNKGQCGHGSKKDAEQPKKVEYFTKRGIHIIKISCGGYHTIVMDENNQLYGFGKGIYGQCGYGQPENTDTPKKIIFNDNNLNKIIDIKCGGEHSIFLSNNGRVYACGHGYYGQLGLGNNKNVKSPILVNSLSNKNIIEIAAGWSHTLVLTDEGFVYVAGCGKFGELGLGETKNRYNYTWIKKLGQMNVRHIFAGGHHSWCIIDDKNPLKDNFKEPEPLEKPNYKMMKRQLSGVSDNNNLSFNDTDRKRKKASNTVDYKNRKNPYNNEDYGHNKNNSFDNKINNLNIFDNKELKRMIDNYNEEKDNSLNNIDNLIDCFDRANTPEPKNNKINNDNIINDNDNEKYNNNINNRLNKDSDNEDDNEKYTNINDNMKKSNKINSKNNSNKNSLENSYENNKNKIDNFENENDLNNNIYNNNNDSNAYINKNNNNNYNNLDDNNDNNNEGYNNNNDDNINDDEYIRNLIHKDNENNKDLIGNNSKNNNNNYKDNELDNKNNNKNNVNNNILYNDNDEDKDYEDYYNQFNQNKNNKDFNNKDNYINNTKYNSNNSQNNNKNSKNYNKKNQNLNKFINAEAKNNNHYNDYNKRNVNLNNNNNNYEKTTKNKSLKNNDSLSNLNINKMQLQVIYSELNLSHRFIRFKISNTNKYYKIDFNSLNNMIKQYLSSDKGNISFKLQNDREVLKEGKSAINPMMEHLLKDMKDANLLNTDNKNNANYTLAIVYDYNRNEMYKRLYNNFKEKYSDKGKNFLNFKIIDENQILNEQDGLEGVLSRWTIDFFENFKQLFVYYEDNIVMDNLYGNQEKIYKPKFLEIRPKLFK